MFLVRAVQGFWILSLETFFKLQLRRQRIKRAPLKRLTFLYGKWRNLRDLVRSSTFSTNGEKRSCKKPIRTERAATSNEVGLPPNPMKRSRNQDYAEKETLEKRMKRGRGQGHGGAKMATNNTRPSRAQHRRELTNSQHSY